VPNNAENRNYIKYLEESLSAEYDCEVHFQPELTLTALDYVVTQGLLPSILASTSSQYPLLKQAALYSRPQDLISEAFKRYKVERD